MRFPWDLDEHAQDGHGFKHAARRLLEFLLCWAARSRALCARSDADLKRELAHHLHELTAEYERQGYSREEAMWMAKREFGGSEQVKEKCRDERRWKWMSGIWKDVAFAFRQMR